MRERIVNLPNTITLLRLFAAPVVVWLVLTAQWNAACWLFLAAALSDGVDGYLARRLKQTTVFGAALDAVTGRRSASSSPPGYVAGTRSGHPRRARARRVR